MSIRIPLDATDPELSAFTPACEALKQGLVVAFPTDTLYGLAVDPRSETAVRRLYAIKRRPPERALPLIAADLAQVEQAVGTLTPLAGRLAVRFWPGPLALVIPAHPSLAATVTAGGRTVAVRVPDQAVARALARAAGHPVTATSANLSGGAAATTADEVLATFGGLVAVVLDAGTARGGAPSTIVDAMGEVPVLVRAGAVPWSRVLESLR